jgi:nucleotidyltransferase/DNA polymerase involved in DNA repair
LAATDAPDRTILHVDLDAFYAAVEVREDPSLKGRPVVVGADPKGGRGRGVVSAASYEARRFGIHSAMPIQRAFRLCPDAAFIPPRMGFYAQVSRRFMAILERVTDQVEPLSIDEAFLDVTGSTRLFGDGETIAKKIQREVEQEERLSASVGVAPSKFVAKIASDLRKPHGLVVVKAGEVERFLAPLPLERLFGAGPKTAEQLHRLGAKTIGEVAALPLEHLVAALGESGARHFHELAHGRDERRVEPDREARSLGHEHTFDEDVADREEVARTLLWLADELCWRLRRHGLAGRTVSLKLRTDDFRTVHRAETVEIPIDTADALLPVARRLLARADTTRRAIRLVGISLSQFDAPQRSLFVDERQKKEHDVASALDKVKERFGDAALTRAALMGKQERRNAPGPKRARPRPTDG